MKLLKNRRKQLATGLCCILAAFATVTKAEDIPSLKTVVADVAKATMPARNYSASVHQKVFQQTKFVQKISRCLPVCCLKTNSNW
jgi:hypothetical protein